MEFDINIQFAIINIFNMKNGGKKYLILLKANFKKLDKKHFLLAIYKIFDTNYMLGIIKISCYNLSII